MIQYTAQKIRKYSRTLNSYRASMLVENIGMKKLPSRFLLFESGKEAQGIESSV